MASPTSLFLTADRYRALSASNVDLRVSMVRYLASLVPWASQAGLLVLDGVVYFGALLRRDGRWHGAVSPLDRGAYRTAPGPDGKRVLVHTWAPLPLDPPDGVAAVALVLAPGETPPGWAETQSLKRATGPLLPWEVRPEGPVGV